MVRGSLIFFPVAILGDNLMTQQNLFPLHEAKQSSVLEVQCLTLVSIIELKLISLNSVSARSCGGGRKGRTAQAAILSPPMTKIKCTEIWSNQFLTIKVPPLNKLMSSFPSLEAEQ